MKKSRSHIKDGHAYFANTGGYHEVKRPVVKEKEIKCPICKGSGLIKKPKTNADAVKLKEKAAKILREQGFSVRAIQSFMGYKSPRAVTYLLEK